MNDTPRTVAEEMRFLAKYALSGIVTADFARTLERELVESKQQLDRVWLLAESGASATCIHHTDAERVAIFGLSKCPVCLYRSLNAYSAADLLGETERCELQKLRNESLTTSFQVSGLIQEVDKLRSNVVTLRTACQRIVGTDCNFGYPHKYVIDTARNALEETPPVAVPQTSTSANPPVPVSSPAEMNAPTMTPDEVFAAARRKLIVHFFRIGTLLRYQAATNAEVWEEADEAFDGQERWARVFERAEKNKKLKALWDAVAKEDQTLAGQINPFTKNS